MALEQKIPAAPIKDALSGRVEYDGLTRKWLEHQYVTLDRSAKQIADEIGTTHNTVIVWLDRFKIPKRDRAAMNERHSDRMSGEGNPAWRGGTSRNYQIGALRRSGRPQVCEWCGTGEDLQVHHRDQDTANGDLENLAWLCGHCNMLEAHIRGLVEAGRATVTYETGRLAIEFMKQ